MIPIKEFSENREMFKPRMRFLFMDCLSVKNGLNYIFGFHSLNYLELLYQN